MPFTASYGLPGRGKSLLMLQHGLEIAEKSQLRIVTNFCLDPLNLAYYCKINNYKWLWENLPKGIVYYVSANKNFAQFLQIHQAVILLDEMGLYAPSVQSWTLPPEAFNAVANNRKRCQHIVYAAQYPSQVNSAVHQICSNILYAEGLAVWDSQLRNERLMFKDVHLFLPAEFEVWFRDPKTRKNPVKVWVLALKHWKGIINGLDAQTFRVYDSFGLLEEQDLEASKFANVSDFGDAPYIIDSASFLEISSSDLIEEGRTFKEIEEILDTFYKAERLKKKKIYEANNNYPFVAWKLQGEIGFPGSHPLQKYILRLWQLFPAVAYPGLKRLDLRCSQELINWNVLPQSDRDYLRVFFITVASVIFAFLILSFLPFKHPLILLLLIGGLFVLFTKVLKS